MILLFSNVVIRTSDVIDLKRDVPVGCKQADEDQLTFEILEKAENQDNFQELLLASPKTYPDLATKYEETKCVAAPHIVRSPRSMFFPCAVSEGKNACGLPWCAARSLSSHKCV